MTEMLQKSENVAENVANKNSQDLTEQWKKGELEKCKDYYVKYGDYEMSLTLDGDNDFIFYGRPIKPKVLAPVPNFEELQNMNEAVNQAMAANIKLVEQNAQLKEQINHLLKTQARQFVNNQKLQVKAEKAKDVVNIDTARQIKQLKELLKECKDLIELMQAISGIKQIKFTVIDDFVKKINEVLNA